MEISINEKTGEYVVFIEFYIRPDVHKRYNDYIRQHHTHCRISSAIRKTSPHQSGYDISFKTQADALAFIIACS